LGHPGTLFRKAKTTPHILLLINVKPSLKPVIRKLELAETHREELEKSIY
jgi:hypothetical protein